jgi:hypothetical protein
VAVSIDPQTFIIFVPKTDMTLVQTSPFEVRELDLNWFRLQLKAIEADSVGIYLLKTHDHNTEVTLGGLTFARVIEILAPYTVTFEDGNYAVNLVNANSNVSDKTNLNQVQVRSANSAGLVASTSTVTSGDVETIASAVWDKLVTEHETDGTFGHKVGKKLLTTGKFIALK